MPRNGSKKEQKIKKMKTNGNIEKLQTDDNVLKTSDPCVIQNLSAGALLGTSLLQRLT